MGGRASTWPRRAHLRGRSALAHLPLLSEEEALRALKKRARALKQEKRRLERQMRDEAGGLPRVFVLETECLAALMDAEIAWIEGVIDDLSRGAIAWSEMARRREQP